MQIDIAFVDIELILNWVYICSFYRYITGIKTIYLDFIILSQPLFKKAYRALFVNMWYVVKLYLFKLCSALRISHNINV